MCFTMFVLHSFWGPVYTVPLEDIPFRCTWPHVAGSGSMAPRVWVPPAQRYLQEATSAS